MQVDGPAPGRGGPLALRLLNDVDDERSRIAAARAGDIESQDWLIRRYTPPVYRFCLRFMRNDEDARDVCQDALVKVMRNLHRYDPERPFSSWVFGIARNAAIDEQRRRKHIVHDDYGREVCDTAPSPLDFTSRHERAERLHEALGAIPPMYREVLVLYHFEHLKYHEIADALDIPIGTVMNRIFRARRKLRDAYGLEHP